MLSYLLNVEIVVLITNSLNNSHFLEHEELCCFSAESGKMDADDAILICDCYVIITNLFIS